MTMLNDTQIKLAEQLLLTIKNKESVLYYSELAERISPPIHHRQIGKHIGQISLLCHELGLPLLSAKVINKSTNVAGEGFYPLYEMLGIPINGRTEKELYDAERKAIRDCTEWYKLEEHVGLKIGLPRPYTGSDTINATTLQAESTCQTTIIYQSSPYLDAKNPQAFDKSVDILNHCFGEKHLGKKYDAWMRGSIDFQSNGMGYTVWFPKISAVGKPTSSSGWINTISNDGRVIEEYGANKNYYPNSNTRLVFAKFGSQQYKFIGVFIPDFKKSTLTHHFYVKIAEVADFTTDIPSIHNSIAEFIDDDLLVKDLKETLPDQLPAKFQYKGVAIPVPLPKKVEEKDTYPRNRQTAINALIHANFSCEISAEHYTFIRRQSGKQYTEPHHLVPMAQQPNFNVSLDVEENIISLCSTCHDHIHYGQGADALIRKLYAERKELLSSVGIDITEEELLSFY